MQANIVYEIKTGSCSYQKTFPESANLSRQRNG
ncbi:hypothetical protein [Pantoea piersonii]|nr:hypothetical protein [Pantoea piersonii]